MPEISEEKVKEYATKQTWLEKFTLTNARTMEDTRETQRQIEETKQAHAAAMKELEAELQSMLRLQTKAENKRDGWLAQVKEERGEG